MEEPLGFQPRCLDCGYDLEGLEDGRCPECGVRFTRKTLVRMFIARQRSKEEWLSWFRGWPAWVLVYCGPLAGRSFARDLPTPLARYESWWLLLWIVIALAVHAAGVALWFRENRQRWIAIAHHVLAFIPPMLVLMPVALGTPIPAVMWLAIAAYALSFAHLALKWSPATSAVLLVFYAVGPMLIIGFQMFIDGRSQLSAGNHWSNTDYPTFRGGRALSASQCYNLSLGIFALAVTLTTLVGFVARRAWVRLTHRD